MRVALGSSVFDVARRALIVGRVAGSDPLAAADHLVAAGADALELDAVAADVARVRSRLDVPIVVRATDAASLRGALAAGATAAVITGTSIDAEQLTAIVDTGDAVLVEPASPAVSSALERAGVPPSRMITAALIAAGAGPGPVAAAITGGIRVIRTADVRTARRVADVLAAVLAARDEPLAAP